MQRQMEIGLIKFMINHNSSEKWIHTLMKLVKRVLHLHQQMLQRELLRLQIKMNPEVHLIRVMIASFLSLQKHLESSAISQLICSVLSLAESIRAFTIILRQHIQQIQDHHRVHSIRMPHLIVVQLHGNILWMIVLTST